MAGSCADVPLSSHPSIVPAATKRPNYVQWLQVSAHKWIKYRHTAQPSHPQRYSIRPIR